MKSNEAQLGRSPEGNRLPGENILVHSDLGLRHAMIAELLNIPLDAVSTNQWYHETDRSLTRLLSDNFDYPITLLNGQQTKSVVTSKLRRFRTNAAMRGAKSVVISMDPIYGDAALADYVFQEARVSLVQPDKPAIDLEHNRRGYTNRFARLGPENNGAGKSSKQQLQEIESIIGDTNKEKVHVAFVEDYINTGISIMARFAPLLEQSHIQPTFIPGVISRNAYDAFRLQNYVVDPVWKLEKPPKKYIDVTDIIPTLGGRGIGSNRKRNDGTFTQPVVRTVGGFENNIPLGVDAIVGHYPWQVDIYTEDHKTDFMLDLKTFSLNTGLQFWSSLEQAAGSEITWKDLKTLNGNVKVFYPIKDGHQSNDISLQQVSSGPRKVIERLIEEKDTKYGTR